MSEETIHIEVPILIPGITNHNDSCLVRLEAALKNQRGIHEVVIQNQHTPMLLTMNYDPAEINIDTIRKLATRAGANIASRYHHEAIAVEGMDCSDCVVVLEHGLRRTSGILSASVNYAAQTLHVEYDSRQINRPGLEKRVQQLGYQVPAGVLQHWAAENREILFSVFGGLMLLLAWGGTTFLGFPAPLGWALYFLSYIACGWEISQHAYHALRERQFDTDTLMLVAALGAAALGEFAEGALLLLLFSIGHALEERALDHARGAIRALGQIIPKTALVRRGEGIVPVSVDHLQLDEVVIVQPGVRLPVDGVVLSGQSAVDQSPVTGESIPVDKKTGDAVFAGTINGEGALEVKVSRLARDSTLARVIQMVEEAQAQKSPTQLVIERFMRWFVPAVLVGALVLIVIPPLFGVPFKTAFLRAMTVLVAASPCALALGTPSAILSGVARAARGGVLVKGGMHLENLGRLHAIAFDKTGTITRGKPELVEVFALPPTTPEELLSLAAAVESWSGHPLAQAVVRGAAGLDPERHSSHNVTGVTAITGQGVQAWSESVMIRVGNLTLFNEAGIVLPQSILEKVALWENQGKTAMVVWRDPQALGVLAVADTVRPEASLALRKLRQLGVGCAVMLTGDQARAAENIARQVGIADVRAGLLPEDKLDAVRGLVQKYGSVAMVGDGVNDAPALALASVGIAMGSAGTDVALESADVALIGDDLNRLPFAIRLGRATRSIILQNLTIALGVIALLIFSSVLGWISIGAAVVFHEGSTVAVALNSLRLLTHQE
jgi:Zn2+/Cd2+-exporting ATPase